MEAQANHSDSKDYRDVGSFVPWDNPDNVITFETFIAVENSLICYLNPFVFCVGVTTNVLSCVVFFRQGSVIVSISY